MPNVRRTGDDIRRHQGHMGWLSRLAGLTEHLKLDVLVQFDILSGQGVAALRWVVVRPHPSLSAEQCKIALCSSPCSTRAPW